jgi:hypothetical protein
MKTIRLTEATYNALAAAAILPFRSTAERQADGTWLVPIEDDTYERLEEHRLPGESDDDTVIRMLRVYHGQRPS